MSRILPTFLDKEEYRTMKKKIGTMLDEDLIFKAKQAALAEGLALSHFLSNALTTYLRSLERDNIRMRKNVCSGTRGALSLPLKTLKLLMQEHSPHETL